MIYLDNAATTPMEPEVVDVMARSLREDFANSGTVYSIGVEAREKIERAREEIANCLSLPSNFNLVFTSGGSEANNLFIKGLSYPDKKAACTGLEHPSVVETLLSLPEGNGFLLPADCLEGGRLKADVFPLLKEKRVRLLCLSHVNNELGLVHPIERLSIKLKEVSPQTRLFVDGVQAVGKLNLARKFWENISGYSLSAHKFSGPKGIGLLAYDSRLTLHPLIHGGKQQYGARSGTLPTPLILGMTHALKLATERLSETRDHLTRLHARLVTGLKQLEADTPELEIKYNSEPVQDWTRQSSAILNFSFPPVEGEVLLHHLEEKNIFVGLGSACSAHSKEPSKILRGIGCSEEEALCSLRVSFSRQNTEQEIDIFLREFRQAYQSLYPAFRSRVVST